MLQHESHYLHIFTHDTSDTEILEKFYRLYLPDAAIKQLGLLEFNGLALTLIHTVEYLLQNQQPKIVKRLFDDSGQPRIN